MASLPSVLRQILEQCGKRRLSAPVTDALAIFVVRMMIYDNPDRFSFDRPISDADIKDLVDGAVGFLCQEGSPQLETVRMQVAFDSTYYASQKKLDDAYETRDTKLADYQRAILGAGVKAADDFDARTALYRQIFSFVMTHAGAQGPPDADVQREVAAALESVFPRVGLKAFVSLSSEDKSSQLKELSHLILGIRVFNWDIGKGGAGIQDLPKQVNDLVGELERRLQAQVDNTAEVCEQYVDVLVSPSGAIAAGAPPDTDAAALQGRWKDELANRRQLASFLNTISEDVRQDKEQFDAALASFRLELDDVKRLVAGRSSVPKEQVYPKFHAMATHWLVMQEIRDKVLTRKSVHGAVSPFVPPSICTLHLDTVKRIRQFRVPHGGGGVTAAGERDPGDAKSREDVDGGGSVVSLLPDEAPVRLSLESSPDFMQLPLEFQGYCSHTLVNKQGLLVPGDPSLGVVRFQGKFFVFSDERGITDFLGNPLRYTQGVLSAAKRSPELVHLLQLQAYFPQASLAGIVRGGTGLDGRVSFAGTTGSSTEASAKAAAASSYDDTLAPGAVPKMKDASTETPTHFVERHIDPRYHWNEWAMRRQALKYANITNSRTVSVQSHLSYFRRDNDTQVYPPKEGETQTGISVGTNPIRVVRYIEGLRGGAPVAASKPAASTVRVSSYSIELP